MSAREDAELLTTGEVAKMFGVNPKGVTKWGSSGRLVTGLTPGGHRRFFGAEVRALLRGESREKARELGLAEQARLAEVGRA